MLPLLLASALLSQGPPRDTATAARIPQLFHDVVILDDSDPTSKAATDEVRRLFAERGLITIAEAGDEASYTFVSLVCDITPVETRENVLRKVRAARHTHSIPDDAAAYCEARTNQEKLKAAAARRPPMNPALRDEIQRLFVTDQAAREGGSLDFAKLSKVDREHEGPLTAIFEKYGVPTYAMVGPEAASQFAIMIQHQPADFRRKALPKLKVNVGRPQRYGENFECNDQHPVMHPAPIEDDAHVNERRALMGRGRIELPARIIAEVYAQAPCAKPASK